MALVLNDNSKPLCFEISSCQIKFWEIFHYLILSLCFPFLLGESWYLTWICWVVKDFELPHMFKDSSFLAIISRMENVYFYNFLMKMVLLLCWSNYWFSNGKLGGAGSMPNELRMCLYENIWKYQELKSQNFYLYSSGSWKNIKGKLSNS